MTALARFAKRVQRHGNVNDSSTTRPLLSLAEFFEGNEFVGSIGCNLSPPLKPAVSAAEFERIAARHDAGCVLVQITMFADTKGWPFTDTV